MHENELLHRIREDLFLIGAKAHLLGETVDEELRDSCEAIRNAVLRIDHLLKPLASSVGPEGASSSHAKAAGMR
jgi:hypothetical protein